MKRQEKICNAASKYANGNDELRCHFIDGAHYADKTLIKKVLKLVKEKLMPQDDGSFEHFKKQLIEEIYGT